MTELGIQHTCYRCGQVRSANDFIKRVDDRYYGMCRQCLSNILASRSRGKRKLEHTEHHRTCYLCRRVLPVGEFTQRSNGSYFSACKECNKHVFAQRRRARMLCAEGDYTVREWMELLEKFPTCPGCGRLWVEIPLLKGRKTSITVDHVHPISKGGRNSIENIQPLCYSCNSRKGDKASSS